MKSAQTGGLLKDVRVKIQISHLTDSELEKVFDLFSEQAIFMAQLLMGEMPREE